MPTATALRIQIEHALERRFPAALTPVQRTIREVADTGISEVDDLLDGGLPVGAISEVTGPESSGRTSLALSFLAGRTQEQHACAWIDAADSFDPESAAANGVNLKQLLWVRCQGAATPEKSKTDTQIKTSTRVWTRLDQALRAADLLLQAGGFAAIVLDLGSTAPEHANRIPLATWFRFRQAADRTRCSLVVLGQAAFSQSSAALVLECAPLRARTRSDTVLSGFCYGVQKGRQRLAPAITGPAITGPAMPGPRKLPASTWMAAAAWDAEKRA
jgi:recombination protein RecA